MGSNFSVLIPEFRELAEPAVKSERLVMGDARAAGFYAHLAELDALFASLQHRTRGEL